MNIPNKEQLELFRFHNGIRMVMAQVASNLYRGSSVLYGRSLITSLLNRLTWLATHIGLTSVRGCIPCELRNYFPIQESDGSWSIARMETKGKTKRILVGYAVKKQSDNAYDAIVAVNIEAVSVGRSQRWMDAFEQALTQENQVCRLVTTIWNMQILFPVESPEQWLYRATLRCKISVNDAIAMGPRVTGAYQRRPVGWILEMPGSSPDAPSGPMK